MIVPESWKWTRTAREERLWRLRKILKSLTRNAVAWINNRLSLIEIHTLCGLLSQTRLVKTLSTTIRLSDDTSPTWREGKQPALLLRLVMITQRVSVVQLICLRRSCSCNFQMPRVVSNVASRAEACRNLHRCRHCVAQSKCSPSRNYQFEFNLMSQHVTIINITTTKPLVHIGRGNKLISCKRVQWINKLIGCEFWIVYLEIENLAHVLTLTGHTWSVSILFQSTE